MANRLPNARAWHRCCAGRRCESVCSCRKAWAAAATGHVAAAQAAAQCAASETQPAAHLASAAAEWGSAAAAWRAAGDAFDEALQADPDPEAVLQAAVAIATAAGWMPQLRDVQE